MDALTAFCLCTGPLIDFDTLPMSHLLDRSDSLSNPGDILTYALLTLVGIMRKHELLEGAQLMESLSDCQLGAPHVNRGIEQLEGAAACFDTGTTDYEWGHRTIRLF